VLKVSDSTEVAEALELLNDDITSTSNNSGFVGGSPMARRTRRRTSMQMDTSRWSNAARRRRLAATNTTDYDASTNGMDDGMNDDLVASDGMLTDARSNNITATASTQRTPQRNSKVLLAGIMQIDDTDSGTDDDAPLMMKPSLPNRRLSIDPLGMRKPTRSSSDGRKSSSTVSANDNMERSDCATTPWTIDGQGPAWRISGTGVAITCIWITRAAILPPPRDQMPPGVARIGGLAGSVSSSRPTLPSSSSTITRPGSRIASAGLTRPPITGLNRVPSNSGPNTTNANTSSASTSTPATTASTSGDTNEPASSQIRIAVGCEDGTAYLLKPNGHLVLMTMDPLPVMGATASLVPLIGVTASPNGQQLCTYDTLGTLRIWDATTRSLVGLTATSSSPGLVTSTVSSVSSMATPTTAATSSIAMGSATTGQLGHDIMTLEPSARSFTIHSVNGWTRWRWPLPSNASNDDFDDDADDDTAIPSSMTTTALGLQPSSSSNRHTLHMSTHRMEGLRDASPASSPNGHINASSSGGNGGATLIMSPSPSTVASPMAQRSVNNASSSSLPSTPDRHTGSSRRFTSQRAPLHIASLLRSTPASPGTT
jgi:hypothetical protein